MKRNTFLLLCLLSLIGTGFAQETNITIEELLARSANLENPAGTEPADLYTPEEKAMLQAYFNANNSESNNILDDRDVYVASIYGGCNDRGFGTFPLSGPYNIDFINSYTTKYYAGDRDDAGNLYGVSSDVMDENGYLVKLDPESGDETVIGNLNLPDHHLVTDLSWNTVNQTMYVMSSNAYNNKLYTVNLETAELTEVGGDMATRLGIWLAIDNEGNAYTMDIGPDMLYAVDLETAEVTPIGSTGVDLRNAQDGGFDRTTGTLYAAGYHGGGVSRFYSVDTNTGALADLGSIHNGCAEIGMVAFLDDTIGIADNVLEGFSFYPNPTNDMLNLKSAKKIDSVTIYNLLGQEVMHRQADALDLQLNISSFSGGAYIMKVIVDGKPATFKIIKN